MLIKINITLIALLLIILSININADNNKTNIRNKKSFNPKEDSSFVIIPKGTKILSVKANIKAKKIRVNINRNLSFMQIREDNLETIYKWARVNIPNKYSKYKLEVFCLDVPVESLIPNIYRKNNPIDKTRIFNHNKTTPNPVVKNISKPYQINKGLNEKHIALWHSHGWYYNHKEDRWMWQRARLFQVVEDLGTMAFTIPYLVPMLENAGANTFLPRERDIQLNEVVIDNEDVDGSYLFDDTPENQWNISKEKAFKKRKTPYKSNVNPFIDGNHSIVKSDTKETATASYIPKIPEKGKYAVYISYVASEKNVEDALYTVYHLGGKTNFVVNQKIGGNTWIYLGHFTFDKGMNKDNGKVILSNKSSSKGKIVSSDAIKFGGGMGIIERNGTASNKPKFVEAARYWMQYAGMPDSLVYSLNKDTDDYKDDYQLRGEWVNYLVGSPFGPEKNPKVKGLGIPIDLSLAFHTDAGKVGGDSTIGTLAIYSIDDINNKTKFPNKVSRLANRDLADIMQTEIVNDISKKYNIEWTRRDLRNFAYSETARPNIPSVLIELLSHQNFNDAKYLLDPRFRFDVSRSIYKSILKYLSFQSGQDYIVQPLPVSHFYTDLLENNNIRLSWRSTTDPLEPTAKPDKYILYTRIDDKDFDNGVVISDTIYHIKNAKSNQIYSFKITAMNQGGESFPSEILSVGISKTKSKPVLIVNGFNRIAPPASFNSDSYSGFLNDIDAGVPDKYDLAFTGAQHNFDKSSEWITDDMPGHGASNGDYEGKIVAGNTFDFTYSIGKSFIENNNSFVSSSDEAVIDGFINLNKFKILKLIYGEEKETSFPNGRADSLYGKQFKVFPDKMKNKITSYLKNGGNLIVSGAYIAIDLFQNKNDKHKDIIFAKETLKYKLASERAVKEGEVLSVKSKIFPSEFKLKFNVELNDSLYSVEAPDALEPINGSETIMRYKENNYSAAIAYKGKYGIIAFGFPLEVILNEKDRTLLMKYILKYFN